MYRDSALSPSPPKDPQNRYSALNLFAFSEQFTSTARHFETYLGGLSFETVAEAAWCPMSGADLKEESVLWEVGGGGWRECIMGGETTSSIISMSESPWSDGEEGLKKLKERLYG